MARNTQQTELSFDDDDDPGAPAGRESTARLMRRIWILLELLRKRCVSFETYLAKHERCERTFRRDLDVLGRIGGEYGFALSRRLKGEVRLESFDGEFDPLAEKRTATADTMRALAKGLGALVARDLAAYLPQGDPDLDSFLRLALPRLVPECDVAHTYEHLRFSASKRALVRFRYPTSTERSPAASTREREVEPHLVRYDAGRYYLVAYDGIAKGWRQFALDRIVGTPKRIRSFKPRPVPAEYRGDDAIGLFKTGASRTITIELSPTIAAAVTARRWQAAQRVEEGDDGSALIHLEVHDLDEPIRWAFGFGSEARVVAPDEAVARARALARTIARGYDGSADAPVSRPRLA